MDQLLLSMYTRVRDILLIDIYRQISIHFLFSISQRKYIRVSLRRLERESLQPRCSRKSLYLEKDCFVYFKEYQYISSSFLLCVHLGNNLALEHTHCVTLLYLLLMVTVNTLYNGNNITNKFSPFFNVHLFFSLLSNF